MAVTTVPVAPVRTPLRRVPLIIGLVALLTGVTAASMFVGSGSIAPSDVIGALVGRGGVDATTALLVTDYRLPRTLIAVVVGAALGLAGAIIQALTRNPLAEPGILGVNAGAYVAIVLSASVVGVGAVTSYVWWGLGGALVATVIVYLVGTVGRSGANPVRLVLTGVAFAAVLSGVSRGVTLLNPDVFDRVRYWSVGSLQNRGFDILWGALPFLVIGAVLALTLGRSLNSVALGEDLARVLGVHVVRTRVLALVALTLLCGAATAAVGPIAFLGLLVPYLARAVVGPDQRAILPLCLLLGPTVFLTADILGRVVVSSELPVGIVTAFVGAPVLILLVRRGRVRQL